MSFSKPPVDREPSFLVIRRDNIGDLVCTTPLIAALRARFPKAWIGALANRYAAPVLDNNPDLDAVFTYQKAKHRAPGESLLGLYWQRVRLLLDLRRRSIDYVIIGSAGYQASAERFARAVRPRHVIAFDNASRLADMVVPAQTSRPLHQIENTLRLVGAVGIDGPVPPPKIVPQQRLVEECLQRLPQGRPIIGVHLSARQADQRWPDACFSELIGALIRQHGASVVLTWSPGRRDNPLFPGDDDSARAVLARIGSPRLLALPTAELAQFIASLAVCDYVLCSDGAPVHLAAALGKPVVALFGGADPQVWYPWGVPHRVLQPASKDVKDLSMAEVLSAFGELLREQPLRSSIG